MISILPTIDNFTNGMFVFAIAKGVNLVFIALNEEYSDGVSVALVNEILLELQSTDANGLVSIVKCPSIIGVVNPVVTLESDDSSLIGSKASLDNLGRWRVVINV